MKKTLLFTMMALGVASMSAESECYSIAEMNAQCTSPNGEWIAGAQEPNVTFYNTVTKKIYKFEVTDYYSDESYLIGSGNSVANDGTIIGGRNISEAAYWRPEGGENGTWTQLPSPKGLEGRSQSANSISADGKYIVGNVYNGGYSDGVICQVPVLWVRQEDGTYSEPIRLPYPEKDFTGRIPTYALCNAVSDDGNVVGGLLVDYFGIRCQPYACVKGADGEWSLTVLAGDLLNPEGVVFPEYPGEYEGPADPMWHIADYMTAEKAMEYQDALEASLNGDGPEPNPVDYMTTAQAEKFEKDAEEYKVAHDAWEKAFDEYTDLIAEVMDTNTTFLMNQLYITPDGKYLYATSQRVDHDAPLSWFGESYKYAPALIDLSDGSVTIAESEISLMAHWINKDLDMFATMMNTDTMVVKAYIATKGDLNNFMPVEDYCKSIDEAVYEYIVDEMTESVLVGYDEDENENFVEIWEDIVCTGFASAPADLSWIALGRTSGELSDDTFIIKSNKSMGITGTYADDVEVSVSGNGMILVKGEVNNVKVFNTVGQLVFKGEGEGSFSTGLEKGIYIVKVTDKNGNETTLKTTM